MDFVKFRLPNLIKKRFVLPRRQTHLVPKSDVGRVSILLIGVASALAVLGTFFFSPTPTIQDVFDSFASSINSSRSKGKLHQKLLLVSRDGLSPKSQDFSDLYKEEARCVEGLVAQGALAVGLLQKDSNTQREKYLRQKLATLKGVVLFPVEKSFLKTFPPSDRRLEVRYPVGSISTNFASQMLNAAGITHAPDFVRVEIQDAVESPVLNLSHLQRILQDPKRTQELVAKRIIVLTPHRDLTAWREWQCLQAVAGGKEPLPRPSSIYGLLWMILVISVPSFCIFSPPRRDLRVLGIAAAFFIIVMLWLCFTILGGVSVEGLPCLAGWLTPTLLWLLLAGGSEMAFSFFPSLGRAKLREIIQGPRLIPVPSCWKKPAFTSPMLRLAPLQKVAAELLLQAMGRPRQSKTDLQVLLKQYDAVSAVRLNLRKLIHE